MRKRGKIDANHTEAVKQLRQAGFTVQSLASVGDGCPDLLVGRNGTNLLIEMKDGTRKPSEQLMTADELKWSLEWKGQVRIAKSPGEAVSIALEGVR